jgi:vacuolar-type H+-ATPase subunit I/STV1
MITKSDNIKSIIVGIILFILFYIVNLILKG